MKTLTELCTELEYAKNAVKHCLKSSLSLVDMHWLVYRAERVEKIRKQIEEIWL